MSNTTIPFSVLMSVYHSEKPAFLDRAMQSIEDQTLKPTEFILVIDGPISTSLEKVIISHKKQNPELYKIVRSVKNRGLGKALQLGTRFVTTNWIARMDSDDVAVNNRFQLQFSYIQNHPNIAVLGGQISEFWKSEDNIIGYRNVPTSSKLIKDYIIWRSPFNHPSVVIKKKSLEEVGGYRPFGKLEDYDLWVRIIQAGFEVDNLSSVLVNMRVDNGTYSRRGDWKNLNYVFRLRKELHKGGSVTIFQQYIGDAIMIANILIPSRVRKLIYQKILHNSKF